MGCNRFEFTVFLGAGVFLVGVICFVFVSVSEVLPARQEQNLKEINCTVAHSEIKGNEKCPRKSDASYPCLRIYVLCGKDANTKRPDANVGGAKPALLHMNVWSLSEKCSYQPKKCQLKTEENIKDVKRYQLQHGKVSSTLRCYCYPENPTVIVREKASQESYVQVILHNILWPLGIILFGVITIGSSACFCASRRRAEYDKIIGVTQTSLQQTL